MKKKKIYFIDTVHSVLNEKLKDAGYSCIDLTNEKKYLEECIDSGWISSEGPFVSRFENEFSKYVGKISIF